MGMFAKAGFWVGVSYSLICHAWAGSFLMVPVSQTLSPPQFGFKSAESAVPQAQLRFTGNGNYKTVILGEEVRATAVISLPNHDLNEGAVALRWLWSFYKSEASGETSVSPQQLLGWEDQIIQPDHQIVWSPPLPTDQIGLFELTAELSNGLPINSLHYQVVAEKPSAQAQLSSSNDIEVVSPLVWRIPEAVKASITAFRVELFVIPQSPFFDTPRMHALHGSEQFLGAQSKLGFLVPVTQFRHSDDAEIFEYAFELSELSEEVQGLVRPHDHVYWRVVGIDRNAQNRSISPLKRLSML